VAGAIATRRPKRPGLPAGGSLTFQPTVARSGPDLKGENMAQRLVTSLRNLAQRFQRAAGQYGPISCVLYRSYGCDEARASDIARDAAGCRKGTGYYEYGGGCVPDGLGYCVVGRPKALGFFTNAGSRAVHLLVRASCCPPYLTGEIAAPVVTSAGNYGASREFTVSWLYAVFSYAWTGWVPSLRAHTMPWNRDPSEPTTEEADPSEPTTEEGDPFIPAILLQPGCKAAFYSVLPDVLRASASVLEYVANCVSETSAGPGVETETTECDGRGKRAHEVASPPSGNGKRSGVRKPEAPAHSEDFRSVTWDGQDYAFTSTQAACVKVLWEAWDRRTPEVGGQTVLDKAECEGKRLPDVFRGHAAWGRMIVPGSTKGSYRLHGESPDRGKG
jgi:hypothetical protein